MKAKAYPVERCAWWRHVSRVVAVTVSTIATGLLALRSGSYLSLAGHDLAHPHVEWVAAAIAAEFVSMASFSQLQRTVLHACGTNVSFRDMLGLTFEANALSASLPAGPALAAGFTFRRFRSWGTPAPRASVALVVTGLLSAMSFAVLAAASAAGGRSANLLRAVIIAGLLAAVGLVLRCVCRRHPSVAAHLGERGAALFHRVRRLMGPDAGSSGAGPVRVADAIHPTARHWSRALGYASLNWVADLLCLLAACRAVGASSVGVAVGVGAYVAGMSASGISVTPGGLGIVEAAMILALGGAGTARADAVAAVLAYRIVSYLFVVAVGWVVLLVRRHREDRRTAATTAAVSSSGLSAAAR